MAHQRRDRTERTEPGGDLVGRQARPQIGAERDHEIDATGGDRRLLQLRDQAAGVRGINVRTDIELDEFVRDSALGEDPGLWEPHLARIYAAAARSARRRPRAAGGTRNTRPAGALSGDLAAVGIEAELQQLERVVGVGPE